MKDSGVEVLKIFFLRASERAGKLYGGRKVNRMVLFAILKESSSREHMEVSSEPDLNLEL